MVSRESLAVRILTCDDPVWVDPIFFEILVRSAGAKVTNSSVEAVDDDGLRVGSDVDGAGSTLISALLVTDSDDRKGRKRKVPRCD